MKLRSLLALPALALGPGLVLGTAAPVGAAPPEYPHGVGVCLSQVASDPSLVGVDHLGQAIRDVARHGEPGSDLPALMDELRGDGPTGCGAPPGPHQGD